MALLKVLIIICCAIVAVQDFKERAVTALLFPVLGLLLALQHLFSTLEELFLLALVFNIFLVSGILGILFLYVQYIRKKTFLNHSFGLGDLLFFYAFALGFPPVTFALLFALSILFSLLFFLLIKRRLKLRSVPLAGLMGVFLGGVILCSFIPNLPSLFSI